MPDLKGKSDRVLTVNFLNQNHQPVPFIRLQGKWLGKYGFQQGDKITVEKQQGLLLIRQLAEQNSIYGPSQIAKLLKR